MLTAFSALFSPGAAAIGSGSQPPQAIRNPKGRSLSVARPAGPGDDPGHALAPVEPGSAGRPASAAGYAAATQRHPSYAMAYVGLATAWIDVFWLLPVTPREALANAKAAPSMRWLWTRISLRHMPPWHMRNSTRGTGRAPRPGSNGRSSSIRTRRGRSTGMIGAVEVGGDSMAKAHLGWPYGRAGRAKEARAILDQLTNRYPHEKFTPSNFVFVYQALGDLTMRSRGSSAALRSRDFYLIFLQGREFEDLWADPRYAAMKAKIGFPPRG